MEVEVFKSSRGNPLFQVNYFMYEKAKQVKNVYYCRCIRKKKLGCEARVNVLKRTVEGVSGPLSYYGRRT